MTRVIPVVEQDNSGLPGAGMSFLKAWSWRNRFDPVLAVAVVATWIAIVPRVVPDRTSDRGIFVSVAERLLAGDALYSGVYDNKEPLFYYFVAFQLALGSWAEVAAEVLSIAIAAAATYVMAVKITSRWTVAAISFIAVPITLTGAFYHPGYTELPGIALVLVAIAAAANERPLLAGSCVGLLVFMKLIFVPIALVGLSCFLLARRRSFHAPAIALGALMSAMVVGGVLTARGELTPFIETIRLNIAYSQGSLIGSRTGLASLVGHIRQIGPERLAVGAAPIMLAIILICIVNVGKSKPSRTILAIAGACVATFFGSLLVLSLTGLWEHHLQILYIPSVVAALGLTSLLDAAADRARLPTLGLVVLTGYVLAGAPGPTEYIRSLNEAGVSYSGLSELSPEARRLLAIGSSGTYARFGTNDDLGHALGLRRWKLACPRFHQYYFEPAAVLNRVFKCASMAPFLIISANFEPNTLSSWNDFVARVEYLLTERYSCDARSGLRVCRRRSPY